MILDLIALVGVSVSSGGMAGRLLALWLVREEG